jgi:hypothetical protein
VIARLFAAALVALCAWLPVAAADEPLTPREHRRGEDQTYLTFPEWFLVHSPAEYAAFLQRGDPHEFPLLAHVRQLWSSYGSVIRATRKYAFNGEYHVMINVIAASTTVEYGVKALYENTVGRLAAAVRGDQRTPEDEFAAATAQRYVDFIRDRPWYEFAFVEELKALWRVPLGGGNPVRKWERRFALSSELIVKAGYGRLIERATRSSFEAPKPVTAIVVEGIDSQAAEAADREILLAVSGGRTLMMIPRYERFTPHAQALARAGARFVEVAGNRNGILLSVLTDRPSLPAWAQRAVIEQPYLTRPGWRRVAAEVPIARLHEALLAANDRLLIEHVYDF